MVSYANMKTFNVCFRLLNNVRILLITILLFSVNCKQPIPPDPDASTTTPIIATTTEETPICPIPDYEHPIYVCGCSCPKKGRGKT